MILSLHGMRRPAECQEFPGACTGYACVPAVTTGFFRGEEGERRLYAMVFGGEWICESVLGTRHLS